MVSFIIRLAVDKTSPWKASSGPRNKAIGVSSRNTRSSTMCDTGAFVVRRIVTSLPM
jgi:hypothetical protein